MNTFTEESCDLCREALTAALRRSCPEALEAKFGEVRADGFEVLVLELIPAEEPAAQWVRYLLPMDQALGLAELAHHGGPGVSLVLEPWRA